MDEKQPINIETTPVQPTDFISEEKDSIEDLNDAVTWQREFAKRALDVSNQIRKILADNNMDMLAETKVLEVTIIVPISFKDLKQHSPAQPITVEETK